MNRWLLVAAIGWLASPARAEDPCAAEAARVCSKARGDQVVLGCLRSSEKELSAACRAELSVFLRIAAEYGEGCQADAYRLCRDVEGEERVLQCLKDNEAYLSSSCQGAFNKVRMVRSQIQASCAGDVGQFCRDVPEGSGRVVTCLRAHLKELTSDCRGVVEKLP
ncbi:MAG TPA: cysteine rich repeat-containing protein [Anaeromyxobacter sp.]|nr:cysteine rich repeat-containing protein [Anaeromyxobacter sp.]